VLEILDEKKLKILMLNDSGNEGPTIKKVFFCTDCKYFKKSLGILSSRCLHGNIDKNIYFMVENIEKSDITPTFCPFLMRKMREEKLKEIEDYDNNL
jgi:hypothetical protein